MKLVKSFSMPSRLNNMKKTIEKKIKINLSFSDFQKLNFGGQQKLLTFGEYSQKKECNSINRRKVISYFYNNLSKL